MSKKSRRSPERRLFIKTINNGFIAPIRIVQMEKTRIYLLVAAALLASSSVIANPPARPTIEQLAAFPQYSSFSLSPDGKHIAALRAYGEERMIAVWQTDAMNQAPTLIGADRMKISAVSFVKDDRLARRS